MLEMMQLKKVMGKQDMQSPLHLTITRGQSVAISCTPDTAKRFIDVLEGVVVEQSCEIYLDGLPVYHASGDIAIARAKEKANPRLTVHEYLKFWGRLFQSSLHPVQAAALVGLTAAQHSPISTLSNSEQGRLLWARCVLQDQAPVVILEQCTQLVKDDSLSILQTVLNHLKQTGRISLIFVASIEQAATLGEPAYRMVDGQLLPLLDKWDQTTENISPRHTLEINKVPVKHRDKLVLLNPLEIAYIEVSNGHTIIYVEQQSYPCGLSLNQLEQRLIPFGFFRSHRSYLVNLQRVRELEAWTKDSYILKLDGKLGQTVPLSKTKYVELKLLLDI